MGSSRPGNKADRPKEEDREIGEKPNKDVLVKDSEQLKPLFYPAHIKFWKAYEIENNIFGAKLKTEVPKTPDYPNSIGFVPVYETYEAFKKDLPNIEPGVWYVRK